MQPLNDVMKAVLQDRVRSVLFQTNLLYVEVQLLWRNVEHRSHKATRDIYSHDVLLTALATNNAVAHQTLTNNLERQEDSFYTCATTCNWCNGYDMNSRAVQIQLLHLGRVWRSYQQHVNGAAGKKFHTRRAEAEHRLLSAGGEYGRTVWNVSLPGSGDGWQEVSLRQSAIFTGFCGGREAVSPPVNALYSLAVVGQLEAVLAWPVAYKT